LLKTELFAQLAPNTIISANGLVCSVKKFWRSGFVYQNCMNYTENFCWRYYMQKYSLWCKLPVCCIKIL